MSSEHEVQISGDALKVLPLLRDQPGIGRAVAKAMDNQNDLTVAFAQRYKLSQRGPDTLGVRTTRLRSSIRRTPAFVQADAVVSSIGSNVVYAAIHEFGGQTKPHDIVPKNGKCLRFMFGGKVVFARKVHHPGSTFPARAMIGSSIRERMPEYGAAVSAAIVKFWEGLK